MTQRPVSVRRSRGFTLVEVVVTLFLVSFGLLGFAALLNQALLTHRAALARSEATILAYDLLERMRVNRAAALSGAYNLALVSNPMGGGSLAGDDLQDWMAHLQRSLPAGDAEVSVDGAGLVNISIQWDDNNDGTPLSFTTQSAL
jgi:type IV pilus assembly protein PilV